ncbi:hypothetical protein LTR70_003014 [Exophiala xenobiotica]|uniref:Uncharacterized protein n=1 Tax=Lithohypha guttulata TaxID=1690604 RepID=A0ABR0K888_9EURO|nr:hypothetical protein LTR24_005694 [Lithohypha guttulata]KAK5324384.1 hypothetical protein LTR70_003014 [Exophiala xenobiotica]
MHIKSSLLLGVSALLTSTVLATPPSIKFCNNDDLNKAKACTTEVIMFDTCRPVPDSNHKGDGGSNFQFVGVPANVVCEFHKTNTDCSHPEPLVVDRAGYPQSAQFNCKMMHETCYWRNYKCYYQK